VNVKPIKYVVVKRDPTGLKVLTRPDTITRATGMLKRMTGIGIEDLTVEANSKEFRKILREERKRSAAARASLKKALQAARKEVNEESRSLEGE
jgi:hypothetical protein